MNKIDKTTLHKAYDKIKSFWTAKDWNNTFELEHAIEMLSVFDDVALRYIVYDILSSVSRCKKDFDVACEILKMLDVEII